MSENRLVEIDNENITIDELSKVQYANNSSVFGTKFGDVEKLDSVLNSSIHELIEAKVTPTVKSTKIWQNSPKIAETPEPGNLEKESPWSRLT